MPQPASDGRRVVIPMHGGKDDPHGPRPDSGTVCAAALKPVKISSPLDAIARSVDNHPMRSIPIFMLVCLAARFCAAADPPASQPAQQGLPSWAVLRLGDMRFAASNPRGGFFSPDGQRLVMAGTVWDATTGLPICQPDCQPSAYFGARQLIGVRGDWKSANIVVADDSTGKIIRKFDRHWQESIGVVAAADGSRFVVDHLKDVTTAEQHKAGQGPRTLSEQIFCDGQTGATLHELMLPFVYNGREGMFNGNRLQLSGDDGTLMIITLDGKAHLIDARTGLAKSEHLIPATVASEISIDGKIVASICADHQLHLFDVQSGDELPLPANRENAAATQKINADTVTQIAIAGLSNLLAYSTQNDPRINFVNLSAQPLTLRQVKPELSDRRSFVISPDGSRMAMFNPPNRTVVIDTQTGKVITPPSVSMSDICAMAVSPDGRELLVGNGHGEIFRWDLQRGKLLLRAKPDDLRRFPHTIRSVLGSRVSEDPIESLSYCDQGKSVLVRCAFSIRLCDSTNLETQRPLCDDPGPSPSSLLGYTVFTPDGHWSVTHDKADLVLTDLSSQKATVILHEPQLDESEQFHPASISDDGKLLFGFCSFRPRLLDLVTHQMGPVITVNGDVDIGSGNVAAFSPDGRWIALKVRKQDVLLDARVLLVPPTSDGSQTAPSGNFSPVWAIDTDNYFGLNADFSSCGELIAVSNNSSPGVPGEVIIRETRTGRPVVTIPAVAPTVVDTRFVPQRPELVTADAGGTVLLWDLQAALSSDPDPGVGKNPSEDRCWTMLQDPNPSLAYRAGLVMLARGQLADLASRLKPISKTDLPGDPPLDDPQVLRSARIIQLLEWSSDPKAAQQYRRLIGER